MVSLMEREWSSYKGGQFNGGRIDHVIEAASLMEGELIMLQMWLV